MPVRMTTGFFEHTEDPVYGTLTVKEKQPFSKRVLIIDDDPDITLTFKEGIEDANGDTKTTIKELKCIHITILLTALSEFQPNFLIFY